jgi:microcystin-dependent protein
MSEPFLGEIRLVAFNFAPRGWALCNGQLLSIAQNTALFALLGTNYGGNGVNTFALPNLQSRFAMHAGDGSGGLSPRVIGEVGGEEDVTLNSEQMPQHNHLVGAADAAGTTTSPNGAVLAKARKTLRYGAAPDGNTFMNETMVNTAGGSQPHDNMPPFLVMNYVIALEGIFPSRN